MSEYLQEEDIQEIIMNKLLDLSKKLHLKKKERFLPYEKHVHLSYDKEKGYFPIAYCDYDLKHKKIKGINEKLLTSLEHFFSWTNNHELIQEIRKMLQ